MPTRASYQRRHLMAARHQPLAEQAQMILDTAEHRVVIFIKLKDVHGAYYSGNVRSGTA